MKMLGSGYNLVKIVFVLLSVAIVFVGGLMNTIESKLPVFISKSFRYGKFAGKDRKKIFGEVPKSWFKHFYVYSSVITLIAMVFAIGTYIFTFSVPIWMRRFCDDVSGRVIETQVSASASLLAMSLLTMQCCRRFYDTQYVSIFSPKGRMNLSHYLVGFTHYTGSVLAILIEAPNFSLITNKLYYFRCCDLSLVDVSAIVLFLWAWYHQYKVTVILANLRKNDEGKVVSSGHFMPEGDWFKYVSSPHSLAEILMYVAIAIILRNNSTWQYVLVWVVSNQIETSLLAHWWYRETFVKYPKERKAIIPFLL